ncbi:MAG: hypothetical protein R3246_05880, partial [Acidimicrobiia bacterium]|nr:hypothetical protein [Acidimicrobiia bacterium]
MSKPIDDLRRYADDLASEVSPFAAQRAVRSAMSPDTRRPRKAIVVIVSTALLGLSNVALAAVADPAVPGDRLYGVDRAYERIVDITGLGGPRVAERLVETGALVEQGRLAEALELVQETLGRVLESDDPQAEIDQLALGLTQMPDVAELVATAHSIASGDATGQDVAELARQLGQRLA